MIRTKILVTIALSLLLVLFLSVGSSYWLKQVKSSEKTRHEANELKELLAYKINLEAKLLTGLIDSIQKDIHLQNSFISGSRDDLLTQASPLFNLINSKYNVTHFYFINLDRTCFLRVHKPDFFGDSIDRYTLKQAVTMGQISHGIELGPLGTFTLRVVYPWYFNGKLQGYLELGTEINYIAPQIANFLEAELIISLKKKYLNKNKWEEGMRLMGRLSNWAQFDKVVIVSSTIPEIPEGIKTALSITSKSTDGEQFTLKHKGKTYYSGIYNLKDASGQHVGDFIILSDLGPFLKSWNFLFYIQLLAAGIIFIFVLAVCYTYIGRIEKNLQQSHTELRTEISEKQAACETVSQQHKFLHNVIDSLNQPFYVIDANDYTIILANSAAQRSKINHNNKCFQHIYNTETPCNDSEHPCLLNKVKELKSSVTLEHIHYDKDGSTQNFEVHGHPIFDADGNIIQIIEYSFNITERKQIESELKNHQLNLEELVLQRTENLEKSNNLLQQEITDRKKVQDVLEQLNNNLEQRVEERSRELMDAQVTLNDKSKLAMIGQSISIELCNPLGVIKNALYFIKMKMNHIQDEKVKDTINIMAGEIDIVDKAVSDMKDLSHTPEPDYQKININQLLEDTLAGSFHYDHISLKTSLGSKLPDVFIDPHQVSRIFFNITENAAQSMKDGGTLRVETRSFNNSISVSFVDTGCGISEKGLKSLFEPLYTTKIKGFGLGLTISKNLAEANNASISIKSKPGQGTICTVLFKLKTITI